MAEDIKTVVTQRADSIPADVHATTPRSTPSNVQVIAMSWWQIILIRATRVYLQSLVGFMSAGGTGLDAGLLPNDFGALLYSCAGLALAPAFFSLVTNSLELLMRLDQTQPEMRA